MLVKTCKGAALFLGLAAAGPALAQSLSGLKVGDALSTATSLGSAPVATEKIGPYTINKWALAAGNSLSVTAVAKTGKIVYLELDWDGSENGADTGRAGLRFGTTSLADLRKSLGSNGFSLGRMGGIQPSEDGSITLINCYAIRSQPRLVVAFFSKLPENNIAEARKDVEKLPELARLDAIVLADTTYLASIWGTKRSYDKAYRDIDW